MKFRKKHPLTVDAMQFSGHEDVVPFKFNGGDSVVNFIVMKDPIKGRYLPMMTPLGSMIAQSGDWIVRDPNGIFSTCTDAHFKATYEPAE